ncbi:hypothetical protein DIJ64_04260 [Mycobacterium leprae]|uniref:Uncharacterized protein n=1 Tax=Mycobacterium leprae TaxID=1769 RepID=A0AAD0KQ85_MYCLR|nr:hypothetical protein [Mycobacterium leprae]AWV47578.1 hypothetical protein DIJ64_04260 [Mycobacterium leprae]OAR21785.1 hypothetical protein A8144_00930 [Mycobacterium leprae 3125609]OAX72327.1 hypothetical protein A3216_01005 [Mycobacterium leprae 7935681]
MVLSESMRKAAIFTDAALHRALLEAIDSHRSTTQLKGAAGTQTLQSRYIFGEPDRQKPQTTTRTPRAPQRCAGRVCNLSGGTNWTTAAEVFRVHTVTRTRYMLLRAAWNRYPPATEAAGW